VGVVLATVVATAVVLVDGALAAAGRAFGRGLVAAVVDGRAAVVVVAGTVVVVAMEVVVSSAVVDVDGSTAAPAGAPVRRMAGSVLRWGMPAMATPTPAHRTSMSTVTGRCPGLTRSPPRSVTVRQRLRHVADRTLRPAWVSSQAYS
jgi:hypothetical protein